jgi:putative nucleotidyltransferase with HDIG domain
MWPFKRKKARQRRIEVMKSRPPAPPPLWRRFRQAGGPGGLLIAGGVYAAVLLMNAWPLQPMPYRLGQYVEQDIHARVAFEVPAPPARPAEAAARRDTMPASFRLNEPILEKLTLELMSLPGREAGGGEVATPGAPTTRPATRPAEGLSGGAAYEQKVSRLVEALRGECILSPAEAQRERRRGARWLRLHRAGTDTVVAKRVEEVLSAGSEAAAEALRRRLAKLSGAFAAPVAGRVRAHLEQTFVERKAPLYLYDRQRTERDLVAPPPAEADRPRRFSPGDTLVLASRRDTPAGRRVVGLTEQDWDLLRLEHEAWRGQERAQSPWRLWARLAGLAAILLAVTFTLCVYLARYEPSIVTGTRRGLTLAALMVLMLAWVKVVQAAQWNPHAAALSVTMGAMVLAIAYDQRLAFAAGAFLSVFAAVQLRASLPMVLVLMTGAAAAAFQLREIRTRSKLVEVSAVTAGAVAAMVWALGWRAGVPWRFCLVHSLWAGGAALLAGFLVQGLLPIIERIFRIATSTTLLEWCDASKPLLKHLAMEAPGSYNHSLQLGALCEAAAEAIGARGLLARTGAYYHDIGKINKPDYFVENQAGSASKHARLSPAMSLLIITGHIKDGLEMAREYGLPPVLHEFIATHHGTTLVQYFYHAAAEQSRKNGADRAPDEMEFRYPGPKPRSKEAAILMLADAAESSVRAMSDPNAARIENQVHTVINRRLMDGQLSECELTLKEVQAIEASLVRSLCGIYHSRIAYPAPEGEEPSAGERTAEAARSAEA